MDPWSIFLYGMKAPMTREKYRERLAKFFDFIVPSIEELREIFDAADVRGKALTLVLVSSGIREGAVPSLRVSDYSKLRTAIPDIGSGVRI